MAASGIFGAQIACQQTFVALGKAVHSLFLAHTLHVIRPIVKADNGLHPLGQTLKGHHGKLHHTGQNRHCSHRYIAPIPLQGSIKADGQKALHSAVLSLLFPFDLGDFHVVPGSIGSNICLGWGYGGIHTLGNEDIHGGIGYIFNVR